MGTDDMGRMVEGLTGVPPKPPSPRRSLTRREKKEQSARVRRFLSLPPQLQEGILKYGESIRQAYAKGGLTKTK